MNIWNLTQLNFFMAVFLHRHVFSNGVFLVLNTLTANIQFLKIQLQVFKMKKKFGTSNSIFKIQSAEIQIVQKVGQRSSTGKSRWSPKSRTKHLLRPGGDMFGSLRLVLSWPWHITRGSVILGAFDLKQHWQNDHLMTSKYRESYKKAVGSYAFKSLLRYFDVIRWSFCSALLQVKRA